MAELFPKFGAPDYSTEITRLSALRPDVVLSTSWGGDLDTLVRQAAQRGGNEWPERKAANAARQWSDQACKVDGCGERRCEREADVAEICDT